MCQKQLNFGGRVSLEFAIFAKFFCIDLSNALHFCQQSEFGDSADSSINQSSGSLQRWISDQKRNPNNLAYYIQLGRMEKSNCSKSLIRKESLIYRTCPATVSKQCGAKNCNINLNKGGEELSESTVNQAYTYLVKAFK